MPGRAYPISLPRFRRTITPVVYAPSRGVQLGRIAVSRGYYSRYIVEDLREGEESPDALKGASYQPPRFRRTITPVVYAPSRGVQLGRIAVSCGYYSRYIVKTCAKARSQPDALKGRILSASPDFAGLLRQLFYAPSRGVQLGRIA